jgi:hypothetical protein
MPPELVEAVTGRSDCPRSRRGDLTARNEEKASEFYERLSNSVRLGFQAEGRTIGQTSLASREGTEVSVQYLHI